MSHSRLDSHAGPHCGRDPCVGRRGTRGRRIALVERHSLLGPPDCRRQTAGDAGTLRAGIEIKLQPGWKTYWRYPGDTGVPPRFDFAGSDNLGTAKVLYPAPHSFSDEAGTSIGYKDSVIFPVHVTPRDPSKPVTLTLKIDYAVCEKLCIPAEGTRELVARAQRRRERRARPPPRRTVPKPVPAAEIAT